MRITANDPTRTVRLTGASEVVVDVQRRTLTGTVYRYGEVGQTSAGPLQVDAAFPPPPVGLAATLEHDRGVIRGHVAMVDNSPERLRIAVRVVDGALGDQALTEAVTRQRAAFSLDIEDADVVNGVIVSGRWEAVGQVAQPAFNSARIDQIAASHHTGENRMNEQQRARLAELAALNSRNTEQETEYQNLTALAVAEVTSAQPEAEQTEPAAPAAEPAAVAASLPAVPASVPAPAVPARTQPRGTALQQLVRNLTAAIASDNRAQAITAALSDITHTAHSENIEAPAWSGELWSGLQYEAEFSDLFNTGSLTSWEGKGWRFTQKLEIQDYAGDKAAIPSGTVTTEQSSYEAARMAVGVDIDRKFYDFPNEGFVNSLLEQVRESWAIKMDAKVRAYVLAQAVAGTRTASVTTTNADATITAANGTFSAADVGATITGTGIPNGTTIASVTNSGSAEMSANATASATVTATLGAQAGTLLKAAARASLILKRRRVGRAGWLYVNDEDMFTLLDIAEKDVSAFLDLFGVEPGNFRSSADIPAGTVVAGVRQAATVRTLPGSPIRVNAQALANGGVDEAFFGYWAIEEQHTSGIVTVKFKQAA